MIKKIKPLLITKEMFENAVANDDKLLFQYIQILPIIVWRRPLDEDITADITVRVFNDIKKLYDPNKCDNVYNFAKYRYKLYITGLYLDPRRIYYKEQKRYQCLSDEGWAVIQSNNTDGEYERFEDDIKTKDVIIEINKAIDYYIEQHKLDKKMIRFINKLNNIKEKLNDIEIIENLKVWNFRQLNKYLFGNDCNEKNKQNSKDIFLSNFKEKIKVKLN